MWLRNLLFLSLVGGGGIALGVNLMPPREIQPLTTYDTELYRSDDFRATVDRVNTSFQNEWQTANVRPADPASDLLVARRLAFGLMGTVPSLEEIRQFESLPPEERIPWWIDHILADRRYDDYFAERLARSFVGTEDGPFIFFRRRRMVSWLSDELAKNRPYDDLVRELIAGEGLWTDKPATNFVSVTAQPDKGNAPDPVRLAGRVTRAFLGLRLDCAQCHNHPFAAWKQSDFEGFSAFFGQTHVGFTGIYDGTGEYEPEDRKTQAKKLVLPKVPFNAELLPEHGSRRQQLAQWVTHPKNPYFARATVNRVWALLVGRPLVDPVDNLETDGPMPPALQILADDFTAHGFDLRRLIRVIANTRVYGLDSAADHDTSEAEEKAWAIFPLSRLRPEQVAGGVAQAASVTTLNAETHILRRLVHQGAQNEFVTRYGDTGEDEFDGRGGTIPQRLLMMNGKLVRERIEAGPFTATQRINWLAPNDARAVEIAYLAALSRRPTPEEAAHFEAALTDKEIKRVQRIEDLFWALLNSTEFSWNH
ncbi:DUF1549 domain-containing protein [Fimbriiglobus ruber]|uniref:DUF1549 domain-containing protein n=1 Tax=Fimbriiglobus ruber TaxID=1908690 RepID=A0A225DCN3_9BACT|nr:DUF1549 domain-containing protein [Fimbriiglobus ruber]OWK35076.1 hypothetical protein FRUB_09918 [Fimbriiglobus ruber]